MHLYVWRSEKATLSKTPPFKEAEFDIMYGKGISKVGNILDMAVRFGVIQQSGAWFSYEGEKLGQGRDNVRIFMEQNQDFTQQIEAIVREKIANKEPLADTDKKNKR